MARPKKPKRLRLIRRNFTAAEADFELIRSAVAAKLEAGEWDSVSELVRRGAVIEAKRELERLERQLRKKP